MQEIFPPWIQRGLQFIHLEFQKLVYIPGIYLSHNITAITEIIILLSDFNSQNL